MTDKSFVRWNSMSDKALVEHIGAFIKHYRLEQNKTQEKLANEAGISRSTLSLMERGETVTLATLIQVLRVLDLLQILDSFNIEESVSPLAMAKLAKGKRKRASGKIKDVQDKMDW
jgi:transcriptional regulator with XRE-family HTH domain